MNRGQSIKYLSMIFFFHTEIPILHVTTKNILVSLVYKNKSILYNFSSFT